MKHDDTVGKKRTRQAANLARRVRKSTTSLSFTAIYDCTSGNPVVSDELHEVSETEGQVDSLITSYLRNGLAAGKAGLLVVRVFSEFVGQSFPKEVLASALHGLSQVIDRCIREQTPQKWRPATDDFGVFRMVAVYQPVQVVQFGVLDDTESSTDDSKTPQTGDIHIGHTRDRKLISTNVKEELGLELAKDTSYIAQSESRAEEERPRFLAALLATVPQGAKYEVHAQRLEDLRHEFNQRVCSSILSALKEELREREHHSFEQKKEIVSWINSELRRFGLAIKSPKTGQPAVLKSKPINDPEVGSFQLVGVDSDGHDKTFTTSKLDKLLKNIDLMQAEPRREGLAEWHARGRPKRQVGEGRG